MQRLDTTLHVNDPPLLSGQYVKTGQRSSEPPIVSEWHFEQLTGVLRRRSGLILTIAVSGALLAGVVGLLIAPKYTAVAEIVVELRRTGPVSPEEADQAIDTHATMLSSRNHLGQVVASLSSDPEFQGTAPGVAAGAGASGTNIGKDSASQPGDTVYAPGKPITNEGGPISVTELARRLNVWIGVLVRWSRGDGNGLNVVALERRLQVMQVRRSRVISVSCQWTSARKAAVVANRIVELYVESQRAAQRAYIRRELARLDTRIAEVNNDANRTRAAAQQAIQQQLTSNESDGREAGASLRELQRQATESELVRASLLQRQKEIRGQQEFIEPDVSVLSLASPPERPSSSNPILFIVPAGVLSLICGCLLAVMRERLDRRLRSERDISDALGISDVRLVPRLSRNQAGRPDQQLLADPFSAYAEAIRSVAATLASARHAPELVLISSSVPGEGKTTLALSLAVHVARLDRRVLLIEFDIRKRSVLHDLGVEARRELLDLHLQNQSAVEFIQPLGRLGFDYLPIPRCRFEPLAPFAREQMSRLLHQLRQSYDCLLIDVPPVLAVAEVKLLASMVDRVLFVLKWGGTGREVARNAVNLLRAPGPNQEHGPLLTCVVTQVNLNKHARYRFGDIGEFLVKHRRYYARFRKAAAMPTTNDKTTGDVQPNRPFMRKISEQ